MARTNDRDRFQYGICTNRDKDGEGKLCPKCESKEVQRVRSGQDFVCDECKEPLRRVAPPKEGVSPKLIAGIAVGVIVVAGAIWGALTFMKGEDAPPFGDNPEQVITPVEGGQKESDAPKKAGIETLSLTPESVTGTVDGDARLKVTITPADAEVDLNWESNNPEVANVDTDGVVRFLKAGEATITVTADGSAESGKCLVTVTEKKTVKAGGNIDYGKWTGEYKNGRPHGRGTLTYNCIHTIDPRDAKHRTTQPGDYIIGEFDQGYLVHGEWHKTNGNVESIMIGKYNQ